jgi:hypothetical protein
MLLQIASQQRFAYPPAVTPAHPILQPRKRGLAGQVGLCGRPAHRQLQRRFGQRDEQFYAVNRMEL